MARALRWPFPLPNPAPAEWSALRPDTPYPCHPRERGLLNREIPGRAGGVVKACATPSRARPREGQVWVEHGLPGVGTAMRRSTARDRLRQAKRGGTVTDDALDVAQAVDDWRRNPLALPGPIGVPYPHRRGSTPCDRAHPLWRQLPDALTDAREEAALATPEDASEDEYTRAVLGALDRARPEFRNATQACVKQYDARERQKAPKATQSQARERAQRRASAVARGEDVTSAEYVDELLGRPKRGKRKR